jgi:uncharacterized membrane protein YdbT with pleckstrin-like domain
MEKTLYEGKPKKNLWFYMLFTRGIGTAIFIGFFGFIFSSIASVIRLSARGAGDFSMLSYVWWGFIVFIIVFLLHIPYLPALVRTYKYKVTNRKITFEGGILYRIKKNVPFHKVTDVGISQDIIEKQLGFSNLRIHTAGTGTAIPEIIFQGIENPEKPRKIISKIIEKFSSDRYGE